eukprot:2968624-Prymnesium_polylepis.2
MRSLYGAISHRDGDHEWCRRGAWAQRARRFRTITYSVQASADSAVQTSVSECRRATAGDVLLYQRVHNGVLASPAGSLTSIQPTFEDRPSKKISAPPTLFAIRVKQLQLPTSFQFGSLTMRGATGATKSGSLALH